MQKKNIVVLISGNGSNLQAFIEAQKADDFNAKIVAVISNNAKVFGLSRAESSGIPAITLAHDHFVNREEFDLALMQIIDQHQADLIILAGFMRVLSGTFVEKYYGRLLNIHPSLLPKYPGLGTHRRVLKSSDVYHGASVHFVTEILDGGSIIAQTRTKILASDNEQSLAARVQILEHRLYPKIAKMLLNNQIELKQEQVYFENSPLSKPLIF